MKANEGGEPPSGWRARRWRRDRWSSAQRRSGREAGFEMEMAMAMEVCGHGEAAARADK